MERMLQKMANQLNAYDEASLMSLWDKYAAAVERFEPTKRWEEAALVFSFIQSVRLKNQLFNQHLAAGMELARGDKPLPGLARTKAWLEERGKKEPVAGDGQQSEAAFARDKAVKRCKILRFNRRKRDKPV